MTIKVPRPNLKQKKGGERALKLAAVLQEALGEHFRVSHDYADIFISQIRVSGDLKHAKIYYRKEEIPGTAEDKKNLELDHEDLTEHLTNYMKKTKGSMSRSLGLRYVPEFVFVYDTGFDEAERVLHLIDDLKKT